MPVPTTIGGLSTTQANNSPQGSENVGPNMNQYFQAAYAFIAQIYNGGSYSASGIDAGGNGGQYRAVNGNFGTFLLNNGGFCYLLQTASGSPTGGSNSYRPFYWNLSNGAVTIDGTGAGTTFGGNITTTGTVTAGGVTCTSDERFKSDWRSLSRNYVGKLAKLKSGTFKLDGSRKRRVGVSAQSLRRILPQAVFVGPKGVLSVDYGGAAFASVVEVAKEVVALRKEVEELKKRR